MAIGVVELDHAGRPCTESDPAREPCCVGGGDQEGGSAVAVEVGRSPQPIRHDLSVPLGWCIRIDRKPASLETSERVHVLRDAGDIKE